MMSDKRVLKSTAIRDIFFNGRHCYITFVLTMQYLCDMPPDLRSNVDYVMSLKDNIIANKQRLHKYFYGVFPTFQDFATVHDSVTANYGALVLDNTSRSNELSEQLSWYRANPEPRAFRIGREIFWRLHARNAKGSQVMREEREDKEKMRALEHSARARADRIVSVQRTDEDGRLVQEGDKMYIL